METRCGTSHDRFTRSPVLCGSVCQRGADSPSSAFLFLAAPLPADGKPASRGPRLRRGWLRRRRAPGGSTVAEVDGKGDDDKILVVVIEDDHMSRTSGSALLSLVAPFPACTVLYSLRLLLLARYRGL